ncbi:MAG: phage tail protein [Alphaproteobacteria bacterium]|nr:phage tail protein [Alphaproteobacteria bacterium]
MAVLALGMVGAGFTSAVGIGATAGWLGGVVLGNLLFGSKTEVGGSKLDDLSVQSSTYGGTIQLVYGTMRVSGNVIWSTDLQENRHESSAGGKGGGGATQVSYTYSVSFAVALCAGPVSAIRRIWADTKLIYDASASNTQATEKYPGVIRIHLGTEDQDVDSTMEMHIGTGNIPAHRGLCYLVFTDLQLADFSNRIPSISAEVVGSGDMACDATILPSVTGRSRSGGMIWPSDGTLIGFTTNSTIYKYDLINNELLLNVPYNDDYGLYGSFYGFDDEGYFYHASDAYAVGMHLVKRHPETLAVMAKTESRIDYSVTGTVQGDKILVPRSRKIYSTDFVLLHDLSEVLTSHFNEAPLCEDGEGNIWQISDSYAKKVSFDFFGIAEVTVMDCSAYTGGVNPDAVFWDDATGYLYFKFNSLGRIVKWDIASGYVAHVDGVHLAAGYSTQGDKSYPQNGQHWTCCGTDISLVNLATMKIEKEYDLSAYMPTASTHFCGCYEKFTHSMIVSTDGGLIKYPLERYGSDQVALADILSDLCLRAGLEQTDFLVNEVDEAVNGYVMSSRSSARDVLEPLLGTYFIDAVETDGLLKFVPRGQDVVATIPYDDLGAVEGLNSDDPVRITETREQEIELPLRIDLTHYDPDRDYQTNTQHASRSSNAVVTRDLESIEVTVVLTVDEAAQVAEKTLTYAWIGRTTASFDLPPKWLRLNPTDVINLILKEATLKVRLTQVDFGANNIVSCQATLEDTLAYSSDKTGAGAALDGKTIAIATPISAFIMDLPMLREADDGLGLYYAFGLKGGSSASLYRSTDAVTWDIVGTGSEEPAFGWAVNALGDPRSPWVWDEDNVLQVALSSGSLDSKTELEVLNYANVALLGDEIIQWRDATLVSSGLYELSGLLRGRRGTEWATGTHTVGERFIVLAAGDLYRMSMGQSQVGATAYYKCLPSGGEWDDAKQSSLAYNAASLRCFAPAHIAGSRDAEGNLNLSWVRRARWNAEWVDGIDVPVFEAEEAYQIDILNGEAVVRTIEANTTTVLYTAAQQIEDFGAVQASVVIAVYQINATVGRGYAGKATL